MELPLGADRRLAGRGEPPQQLRRQRRRAGLGQGAAVERDLPPGVAHGGAEVLAVDLRQPLAGDQPQPQVGGHGAVAREVGQPGGKVEIGVLKDVGGIDPAREPAVESEADHRAQAGAVASPGRGESGLVARSGATEVTLGVVRVLVHRSPPTAKNARGDRSSTGRRRSRREVRAGTACGIGHHSKSRAGP